MQCRSCSSRETDAYRAGSEIGEALSSLQPEVVILFVSAHYQSDIQGMLEGLGDGLGGTKPIVFGCSGDGIYETRNVAHHGISALALNSAGKVKWTVTTAEGVADDSFAAAQSCARHMLAEIGGIPDFTFALANGAKADGSRIVDGLKSVLTTPFIGGLAADDRKFVRTFLLADGKVLEDGVALLAGRGEIRIWMNAASGWTPMGAQGVIDACQGNVIERIDGKTAQEFMREQLGKTPDEVDLGVVPLATFKPGDQTHPALRTPQSFDAKTGAVTVFGSMDQGAIVQVCTATREEVIAGVDIALDKLRLDKFKPAAALVISCAGRKWLMGDQGQKEVDRVLAFLGKDLPLAGFPSFGEMAPFRRPDGSQTPSYFHNVTFVLCVIGE